MTRSTRSRVCLTLGAAALGAAAVAPPASADPLLAGLYRLQNHPDGNQRPPFYGARFDELFNATAGDDVFTLDFDNVQSAAFLTINDSFTQIRIFGSAFGGRDIGADYAVDQYRGVYTFDFTYALGVGFAPGDDDLVTDTANNANSGVITSPGGQTVNLVDERSSGFSFRFGDEDNDAGHRGFDGLSGWGWLSYAVPGGPITHFASTDWIFTATFLIPTPGTAALVGLGAAAMLLRRRR